MPMHWMYQNGGFGGVVALGIGAFPFLWLLPLLLWSLAWKGWALWLAARRGEMVWFVVLLVVNTFGLLEIFYIFAIAKQLDKDPEQSQGSAESESKALSNETKEQRLIKTEAT